MVSNIQQQIINEFGSEITQEAYIKKAEKGLWESEKILIEKYFKPKSTILDIGCGTGRTTIPLCKMGYKIIGIDITPEMIKNAQKIAKVKKLKIFYEVGDAVNLKYKNNSFDNAIFSNNGWIQMPGQENRYAALKEIHRILKSGGYFIFTAHARTLKDFRLFWIKQWIKFYILKPLGVKIEEIDFGDYFFKRKIKGVEFKQKQFIHIPSADKVKSQIKKAGFNLIFAERENKITDIDIHDKDNVYNHSPMFYVCKKLPEK